MGAITESTRRKKEVVIKVGMFCSLLLLPFETSTFVLLPTLYPASVRAGEVHDGYRL